MVDYAESLARTYMNRGESSGDWKDYLKAHGLANYCVAVDSTPERHRLVYDVEVSWYKDNHPISYKEHQQLTDAHKQLLNEYRDEVKSNFSPLDRKCLLLDADDVYSDLNMTIADLFCDELFELSKETSNEFVRVVRSIIESSIEMLKCIKWNASCDFAVIALGSVAKGEATPYSDVEYAIITERDDTNFFQMLAMDTYFRIGNVGETPLKCFDIVELKVPKGSPSIIPDLKTVGFRIDGISKNAGNIPTGNGLDEGQSLTLTVDDIMKLYKTSAESPFTGLADKSDMLSSTVVIYTNEGDISQLHNRFLEERMSYELNVAQNSAAVKEKRLLSFLKDIDTYTFLPEFIKYQPPQNMKIRVKTDIFRYPTLLANNIKMFMGWNLRYPWLIYTKMYSCEKMSDKVYSYIRIVLAISIYMRTRAYLQQRSQTEYISLISQVTGSEKELYQVPSSLFVVLGCLLTPIKHSVKSEIQNISLAVNDTSLASAIHSVMQRIEFDGTNSMAKVEICYFAGEYELACQELCKVVRAPIASSTSSEYLDKIQKIIDNPNAVPKNMELCSYILYHTKSYRTAADFFSWLIDNGHGEIGFWKLLLAQCRKQIGDYRVSRQLLDEAKQHLQQVYDTNRNSSKQSLYAVDTNHRDISITYRDIGSLYCAMGEFEEGIKYVRLALEMDIAMLGDSVHLDIAADYHCLGHAYRGLGEFTSALDCFIKTLNIEQATYGADNSHPDIATSYNNIASVHNHCGNRTLSLEYHIKSIEMMEAIYGADANLPDIAISYNSIANVYNKHGDHTLSLEYYIKSLKIWKALHGANTNHPDIATTYNNIASAYDNRGDHRLSLEYHMKALKMMKAILGADANHPHIATMLSNIAAVFDILGYDALLLEYSIKALEMRKAIYGGDTNHPDIATSYNNIAAVYNNRGDQTLSLECYMKSLKMLKAIHGADTNHHDIATNFSNIAGVYNKNGDYTLSLVYAIKSLEMRIAIYGTDIYHPDIAICYNNIGSICYKQGDYTLSLEYYMKSLKMIKDVCVESSSD